MKIAGVVALVLALAIGALWAAHGAELATREKIAVTTETTDDFGDTVESTEWREPTDFPLTGFHVGLDRAGPPVALLILAGGAFLFFGFRKK